ncbi:MAG: phosphopyruvate hydratase [Patescibacteria group bacterium]|jgi:enolase
MSKISSILAKIIDDSRGESTIEVTLTTEAGTSAVSSIPSGRSKSTHEAAAIPAKDAAENVNTILNEKLKGIEVSDLKAIDSLMIELDGTSNKSNLGGNAILAISIASAKAAAVEANMPLYKYLGQLSGRLKQSLPIPILNVINGGKHAKNDLTYQEFSLMPVGFNSFAEKIDASITVFDELGEIMKKDNLNLVMGDEGGYAPSGINNEQAMEYLVRAIKNAGFELVKDFKIGFDIAASSMVNYAENAETYFKMLQKYPILVLEDPFSEDEWHDWTEFNLRLQEVTKDVVVVGDDLFATNASRLKQGIQANAANGIIIKPNQIGTLTELFEVTDLARDNDIHMVVSHRSGETSDSFIADLAVGVGAEFFKAGAPNVNNPERMNKYTRIKEIEKELK